MRIGPIIECEFFFKTDFWLIKMSKFVTLLRVERGSETVRSKLLGSLVGSLPILFIHGEGRVNHW